MYDPQKKSRGRRPAAFLLAVLLSFALCLTPAWAAEGERQLIPLGRAVGIKLFASGVMVVDLSPVTGEGRSQSPAKSCGLKEGDVICQINGEDIRSTEHFQELLQANDGGELTLQVRRGDKRLALQTAAIRCDDGVWRLGAWIRDSMAGIGTMTYYDPESGTYGALGHGITDVDTALLMPLSSGSITEATVKAVKKGERGSPGELKGDFSGSQDVGTVAANTDGGIFGTIQSGTALTDGEAVPVAQADEVRTGAATILSNVSGDETEEYQVEIMKIYPESQATRNLLIRVTDSRLLEKTGGIVQGMSGSPILQDGRLVGAVTHVLVNDPTQGYGILMENMLKAAG